ncbi:MAG: hypothetical protein WC728_08320 [Elusimicrobiota bacterium]
MGKTFDLFSWLLLGILAKGALDPGRSRKRLLGAFLWTFGCYSALGLFIGNAVKLASVCPQAPVLVPAAAILLVGWLAWRLALRELPDPLVCPDCKASSSGLARFWNLRRVATPRGALLDLHACSACGCEMRMDGRKAEPSRPITAADWLKPAAATLASGLLAILATGIFWNGVGGMVLRHRRAGIERANLHFNLPQRPAKLPDEENAAYWILKAAADPAIQSLPEDDRFSRREPWSRQEADLVRVLLREHRSALQTLKKGLSLERADWGVDWSDPFPWVERGPRLKGIRPLARLLACEAELASMDGRPREAAQAVGLLFSMADLFDTRELLTLQMASISLRGLALDAAMQVLPGVPLPLARGWRLGYLPDDIFAGFFRVMEIEYLGRHSGWVRLGWLDAYRTGLTGAGGDIAMLVYWPFLKRDIASLYLYGSKCLRAMREDYPKAKPALARAERLLNRRWLLSAILAPQWGRLYDRTLVCVAKARLAQAALLAREFRDEEKRWPDAVWELQERLEDPFTGGWLRVVPHGDGIVLYSVGPDGMDDQGAPLDREVLKGDVAWVLRR